MKRTEKKRKQKKAVLICTLATAAVIVGGMTFAWYTSKDQVTNRLSAAGKYGTSIVEDFQSPEDWIPGQEINKDVSVVNTGTVDALVRMYFSGRMTVLKETSATDKVDATTFAKANATAVTDPKLNGINLNYSGGSGAYFFKELSQNKIDNPKDLKSASSESETKPTVSEENTPAVFNEVQSVQAGGYLVYAPNGAKISWELEQATTLKNKAGNEVYLAKGTKVGTTGATGITAGNPEELAADYYGVVDASTFKPETDGLYIFRRTVEESNNNASNKYEYSGYYFFNDGTKDHYLALHYADGAIGKSDYVLPAGAITETKTTNGDLALPVTINTDKVYMYTASEKVIETAESGNNNLLWAYDSTNNKFTVTYKAGNDDVVADDIVVDVQLANVGTNAEQWTVLPATGGNHKTTFYYNNDVESGDTTAKLVDSVKLSENTTKEAYLAFDFDLDVFMDSVQVTLEQDGKEDIKAAKTDTTWQASSAVLTPIGTDSKVENYDTSGKEIEKITWKATSGS